MDGIDSIDEGTTSAHIFVARGRGGAGLYCLTTGGSRTRQFPPSPSTWLRQQYLICGAEGDRVSLLNSMVVQVRWFEVQVCYEREFRCGCSTFSSRHSHVPVNTLVCSACTVPAYGRIGHARTSVRHCFGRHVQVQHRMGRGAGDIPGRGEGTVKIRTTRFCRAESSEGKISILGRSPIDRCGGAASAAVVQNPTVAI